MYNYRYNDISRHDSHETTIERNCTMEKQNRKVKKYLSILDSTRICDRRTIENITICPCDYKTSNTPPTLSEFWPFVSGDKWGSGWDSHAWFHFEFDAEPSDKPLRLYAHT